MKRAGPQICTKSPLDLTTTCLASCLVVHHSICRPPSTRGHSKVHRGAHVVNVYASGPNTIPCGTPHDILLRSRSVLHVDRMFTYDYRYLSNQLFHTKEQI